MAKNWFLAAWVLNALVALYAAMLGERVIFFTLALVAAFSLIAAFILRRR